MHLRRIEMNQLACVGLQEEAAAPGWNPCRHREDMETPQPPKVPHQDSSQEQSCRKAKLATHIIFKRFYVRKKITSNYITIIKRKIGEWKMNNKIGTM